ncbi:zinc-ribbon domain-containing protein [Halosimplex salinum]|uniref:zinc-ribbon domain-containing protein n=1 Tax=Halosimplex salinum TaxID=1710538 RepID=UPI000F4A5599|nr:zinc-ribbon domain-containing protein [Halosimplex salinum]
MGVLSTISEVLRASSQNPSRGEDPTRESEGAYWCHDCEERILVLAVDGDDPPTCPSCGEGMTFERSVGTTGCAC